MPRPEDDLPLEPDMDDSAEDAPAPPPEYDDLMTETAERQVDIGDLPSGKTLTESEDETDPKSDFQIALKELRPVCPDEKLRIVLESARVSRIYPDNLLDKMFPIVMARFEDDEGGEDIDFIQTLMLVQDAMLVGLEGKGIIDVMEMLGATKEAELEKLTQGLGL